MSKGRQVHDENLVVDGLVDHCNGDATDPKTGGINALNITTTFFESDFPEACVEIDRRHDIPPQNLP